MIGLRRDIDDEIAQIQLGSGWREPLSLAQMEAAWVAFVDACEGGYSWSLYEFDNDVSIRDRIELVLSHEGLRGLESIQNFRERVSVEDGRLRRLFRAETRFGADASPWWKNGILKAGGREYVRDVLSRYGLEVEVR